MSVRIARVRVVMPKSRLVMRRFFWNWLGRVLGHAPNVSVMGFRPIRRFVKRVKRRKNTLAK